MSKLFRWDIIKKIIPPILCSSVIAIGGIWSHNKMTYDYFTILTNNDRILRKYDYQNIHVIWNSKK